MRLNEIHAEGEIPFLWKYLVDQVKNTSDPVLVDWYGHEGEIYDAWVGIRNKKTGRIRPRHMFDPSKTPDEDEEWSLSVSYSRPTDGKSERLFMNQDELETATLKRVPHKNGKALLLAGRHTT